MNTGVVIFAHGSSIESANQAVREVAGEAARSGGFDRAEVAFLEPHHPLLGEVVAGFLESGITRIVVVPYFLTLGLHLQRDLPEIVAALSREHPGLEIRVAPPLDGHPALAGIVADRARKMLREWK